MPVIDAESRKYLADMLGQEMEKEVDVKVIRSSLINAEYSDFAENFVKELSEINPKIKFIKEDFLGENTRPSGIKVVNPPVVLIGEDLGYKIVYTGVPAGYEAGAFVDTIVMVSKGATDLSDKSKQLLKGIDMPVHIRVFVTPSCPYCPRAVILANKIAIEAKGLVTAECVEAEENMELSMKWNVSAVPQQVINDDPASVTVGVQPESKFVEQVVRFGSSKAEEIIASSKESTELPDNPDKPVYLTSENFDEAVNKYSKLVVDCWADWCAPCKMIAPSIDAFAKEHQGEIVYGKLNVDENPEVADKYGISSIPTLMVFKDGELAGRIVGAMPKKHLEKKIRATLGE